VVLDKHDSLVVKRGVGRDCDTMAQVTKSWMELVYRLAVLARNVESCSCLERVLAGMADVNFADMVVAAFVDNVDEVSADMVVVMLVAMLDPLRTPLEYNNVAGYEQLAHHAA
jgi:hypothetical protein